MRRAGVVGRVINCHRSRNVAGAIDRDRYEAAGLVYALVSLTEN
jgi:hypothetical protein